MSTFHTLLIKLSSKYIIRRGTYFDLVLGYKHTFDFQYYRL
jgi:hypothetical protein